MNAGLNIAVLCFLDKLIKISKYTHYLGKIYFNNQNFICTNRYLTTETTYMGLER
jgi:hypothetical protein